jgi:hypothetical protein
MGNPAPKTEHLAKTQWKHGQSGNPAGKPKGTKSLSTIVRRLLADEQLLDTLWGDKKPDWFEALPNKRVADAIVVIMVIKALDGDMRAADWLRKTGYGTKIEVESDSQLIPIPILGGLSVA